MRLNRKAHKTHCKIGIISAYSFEQNKGVLDIGENGKVKAFREKSGLDGELINIGFMVFKPQIFDYIAGDDTIFEKVISKYNNSNELFIKYETYCTTLPK